jgi:hypothetical protein
MRISTIAGLFAAAALTAAPLAHAAGLCAKWSPPAKIGALDSQKLKEASGVAVSRLYPGRLYHNQDSGDGPNFYVTDMTGANPQTVSVKSFTPRDVEDIALGPCAKGSCLFLADTGDNLEKRPGVQIAIVPEKAKYKAKEKPLAIVTAVYPDRPHNVEAVAIHPDGDLYLITKSFDEANRRALVAQVFKLTAAQLANPKAVQTFTEVGRIDFPYLLWDYGLPGQIVTGMDISDDGQRVLAITYQNAIEMAVDLSRPLKPSREWKPNVDYRVIETAKLPQAEAIAYTPLGDGFLYDSETVEDGAQSPLYRADCLSRGP